MSVDLRTRTDGPCETVDPVSSSITTSLRRSIRAATRWLQAPGGSTCDR